MPLSSKINFDPLLRTGSISNVKIRNWNQIQEEYAQKNKLLIEYKAPLDKSIVLVDGININDSKGNLKSINHIIGAYIYSAQKSEDSKLLALNTRFKKIGLLMPVRDIKQQSPMDINSITHLCLQLIDNISFGDLIELIKDAKQINKLDQKNPYLLCILFTIENYINTLVKNKQLVNDVYHLGGFLRFLLETKEVEKKTDSYQVITWLVDLIDSTFLGIESKRIDPNKYSKYSQAFVFKYKVAIKSLLKAIKKEGNRLFKFSEITGFSDDLHALFYNEKKLAFVHIVINNYKNQYINSTNTSRLFFEKAIKESSLSSQVKKIFSTRNIIETVQSFSSSSYSIEGMSICNYPYKYQIKRLDNLEIGIDEINTFYEEIYSLNDDLTQLVRQKGNKLFDEYMCELTNVVCSPILNWSIKDSKPIFQLNLADEHIKYKSHLYIEDKKRHEEHEHKELQQRIAKLLTLNTKTALEKYFDSVRPFFYRSNQIKWEMTYNDHLKSIKQRLVFRNRKMKELGIYDVKIDQKAKDIYLNEMLRIEEEVKRFVPFVTEAFKAALPSRKSTELDQHRRTNDGIEFDPETMIDAEKWIRGDVMKPLKVKIETGEVTQVNAFCLDLSGSMNHTRMRNLYKILYLMIMGLESRKSYDAFHFFSNSFIPGVEFRFKHTTKELLFGILQRISSFNGYRIQYHGIEGTNISDGIKGCMISINHFISSLRKNKPTMNLSCSMFVITDGEPSLGITNLKKLNTFITNTAEENNVAIKGVYIKSEADIASIIHKIFGADNSVETASFEEGVNKLVAIMTATYKKQRQEFKWINKKKKVFGSSNPSKN